MVDSDERKSVETEEHDSDDDGVSALLLTSRRLEASDDDNYEEEVEEKLDDDEREGGAIGEEELKEVSQEEEGDELQEMVHVNKGKEKKAVSDQVFVPRHGWFYMHDDRFRSRRPGRRSAMIGMKLWDSSTDEQKWKHDKFEDMTPESDSELQKYDAHTGKYLQDKSGLKSYHQQQSMNRSKGHSYADRNQFRSHDNSGNQNKSSRIARGRGPVKYKPIVKSNDINPSSKNQIPAKLEESTSSSRSPRVSSRALAISCDAGRQVMQLGGLPYVAVDDHAPSMALVGRAPQSQVGSRNCGVTSNIAAAAKPCYINKPLADGRAPELVENEFQQRRLKPLRYSKTR